jgi:hypothetical protein
MPPLALFFGGCGVDERFIGSLPLAICCCWWQCRVRAIREMVAGDRALRPLLPDEKEPDPPPPPNNRRPLRPGRRPPALLDGRLGCTPTWRCGEWRPMAADDEAILVWLEDNFFLFLA